MTTHQDLSAGATLQGGKYRIERTLGQGGFGITYLAHHTLLDQWMAVKEFFPKDFSERDGATGNVSIFATSANKVVLEKMRKKFLEEGRALYKMSHPGIVRVIDIFEEHSTAYYAMEYIPGQSLASILKERVMLPEAEAVGYVRQVCDALGYVHSLNRLHLDINPNNIMVAPDGRPILIDFGASKHYDEATGKNDSTLLGIQTKGYAPIEQVSRSFTTFSPATDIYALGATLYKLLVGVTPPEASAVLNDGLPPRPAHVTAATWAAVAAAMQPRRDRRPQSVAAWLALLPNPADLQPVVSDSTAPQPSPQPQPTPQPKVVGPQHRPAVPLGTVSQPKPRKKWPIYAVAAALLAAIAIAIGLNNNENDGGNNNVEMFTSSRSGDDIVFTNTNGVTFRMVRVDGGTFQMGSSSGESDERPVHSVTLSGYWIGETEVTQALWQEVMGSNPSYFKGSNLPVEKVSWNDCKEFIGKLNTLTGRSFRLPTEAEWEYAARGGNRSNGYTYSGGNTLDAVGWYDGNSGGQTHPVKGKARNELGLYDMSGNVWEWCEDWYGSGYYANSPQNNPTGPVDGSYRVRRGGTWGGSAGNCRVALRGNGTPVSRSSYLGLRLALSGL